MLQTCFQHTHVPHGFEWTRHENQTSYDITLQNTMQS